jgi:hypothetical protein
MSKKTIAKFCGFVISYAAACLFFTACAFVNSKTEESALASNYNPPKVIGTVRSPDITESSGLAASRCQENVLWTHNDSGDDAFIFGLKTSGESLGTWKVPNAQNNDWEDIAAYKDKNGKCFIYVGDIGDNKAKRHESTRSIECGAADPAENAASDRNCRQRLMPRSWFTYPDYDQNGETPWCIQKWRYTSHQNGSAAPLASIASPDFGNPETLKADETIRAAIPNGFTGAIFA